MSALTNVMQECADELAALAAFDDVPIVVEDVGNIETEILRALGVLQGQAGKRGAFLLLSFERAKVGRNTEFGPVFEDVVLTATAVEAPELNRDANGTGKTGRTIAENAAAGLILFKPASANGPVSFQDSAIEKTSFEVLSGEKKVSLPAHEVQFRVGAALAIAKTKVGTPVIEVIQVLDEETQELVPKVQMSCSTPGAGIFYTLDGKKPRPGNAVYTGVFDPPGAGTVIRARGWLSGYLASEVGELTV